MHHGTEFGAVILVSLTLALGALLRLAAGFVRVPYTIALLVLGLVAGVLLGLPSVGYDAALATFADPAGHPTARDYLLMALGSGTQVRPDLIIFCFLPALVFESAFAIELHTFKKTVGAAIVYAVPALLVATALSGALLYALLPLAGWQWDAAFATHARGAAPVVHGTWLACLFFGALISATDPVAVVALLRELGVNKKLSHLIEGESLLNDGTAIVVSAVFLELLVGGTFHGTAATLWNFTLICIGGLIVGWCLAVLTAWVMAHTFNDPLVEITMTIVLGYVAMWVAEGLLHVSGVMALVAAGLWMGGPARTTVSPEIGHFLHQFWELLAYLANTLIFFLVGLIIGAGMQEVTLQDAGLIIAIYLGIMAIRFFVVVLFRPLAVRVGDPISFGDVLVVSWGGLRGAVAMALVLALATNPLVPPAIAKQLLVLTAGVVFLTIAVNGMTMGKLLQRLGYDKPPLAEALATMTSRLDVLRHVRHVIEDLRTDRELRTVRWADVLDDLDARMGRLVASREQLERSLADLPAAERAAGAWAQVIAVEREAYWHAFAVGTLGARAVRALDSELNVHLDAVAAAHSDHRPSRLPSTRGWRAAVGRLLRRRAWAVGPLSGFAFDDMEMDYDLHRAVGAAAAKVLATLPDIGALDPALGEEMRGTYEAWLAESKLGLEELRVAQPEMTTAIETRIARRLALNLEREELLERGHRGTLAEGEAKKLAAEVEERMARLAVAGTSAKLPEVAEVLAELPLFQRLDAAQLASVADAARLVVLASGEHVFAQGDRGDAMFVIVRGAVQVYGQVDGRERLFDALGGGDILGEMALLSGEPRTASARCATAVTLLRLERETFDRLMQSAPSLAAEIWRAFAMRRFDNHLRQLQGWHHLGRDSRCAWMDRGTPLAMRDGDVHVLPAEAEWLFLVNGNVRLAGQAHDLRGPLLQRLGSERGLAARGEARMVLLGPPPEVTPSGA